jgi:hypothetical protein
MLFFLNFTQNRGTRLFSVVVVVVAAGAVIFPYSKPSTIYFPLNSHNFDVRAKRCSKHTLARVDGLSNARYVAEHKLRIICRLECFEIQIKVRL